MRNGRNRPDRSRFAAYCDSRLLRIAITRSSRRVDSNRYGRKKEKKKRKEKERSGSRFTSISCVISRGPTDERTEIARSIKNLYACRVPDARRD